MGRRRYTDEERATALAALAANGGNLAKTARDAGVPFTTLRHWSNGTRHPEAAKMGEEKKAELADSIEVLARRILGGIDDEKIAAANLQQAVTSLGIAVDKVLALRGASQSKTPTGTAVSDDDLERRLAEAEAALSRTGRGEGPPAG